MRCSKVVAPEQPDAPARTTAEHMTPGPEKPARKAPFACAVPLASHPIHPASRRTPVSVPPAPPPMPPAGGVSAGGPSAGPALSYGWAKFQKTAGIFIGIIVVAFA